ncbi:unnamed protein product, partial [Prunus brigantina]
GKKSKSKTPREMQDNIAVGIGGSFLGPLQTGLDDSFHFAIETARGRQLHLNRKIIGVGVLQSTPLKEFRPRNYIPDQRDYVISTPMPDGNLCYNDLLDATVLLFQKSYPNEEFFPETPSPQNLEDDVQINLED